MELKKIEGTNIYQFHATGTISEEDTRQMNLAFQEFKDNGEKIKLLGIIDDVPFPDSWGSIGDLTKIKMNSLSVIEKYAVLTNKKWIGNWVPIGNFFTPGIEVKSFDHDAFDEAINWLQAATEEDETVAAEDYLSNIPIKKISENAYEIHIAEQSVNLGAMSAIYEIVSNVEEGSKVNLLMLLDSFPGFDSFQTFVEGLKIDLKAIGRMGKFAVVSDAGWIDTYAKIGDFMTPGLEMKAFATRQAEDARVWITS
ncbi:SpoIIAA family protein [Winogradskyella aurantiaca]|uniref:STAS/SEC14 domain-containing protein n=1 Tax=Winogradskyella aurantiaca TaxID=2219558 RepID=UPI000E1C6CDF|nr:STAS/SEC14 domain-containing protein [Winogradskyella aurantiaca]